MPEETKSWNPVPHQFGGGGLGGGVGGNTGAILLHYLIRVAWSQQIVSNLKQGQKVWSMEKERHFSSFSQWEPRSLWCTRISNLHYLQYSFVSSPSLDIIHSIISHFSFRKTDMVLYMVGTLSALPVYMSPSFLETYPI